MRRVVVTGMGTINPCGNDVPTTWTEMIAARSAVRRITRYDCSSHKVQIAAEVRGFDAVGVLGRREIRRMGLFTQYGVAAGIEAMTDAAFGDTPPDPFRFGTFMGSGIGGLPEMSESAVMVDQGKERRVSAFFITQCLPNLLNGQLAIRYGARGPSLSMSTACATGNHAIGEAFKSIAADECDVALAGGAEAVICSLGVSGFHAMRALSRRNDDPATASRPFERNRDGFVMGEGSGILVLEELGHALRRDARIYAEVVGYALNNDAFHLVAPSESGEGAVRCMRRAMTVAGVLPADVDYVNAHGTSTSINDRTETMAIREVFGDFAPKLAISSTKSVTGHLLGAAGGVEAIATAMALHTGWVPPTANLIEADPECDLNYVPNVALQINPTVALSNAFGFGGANATLVMRKFEQ